METVNIRFDNHHEPAARMRWRLARPERLAFVCVLLLLSSTGSFAQNAGDLINLFSNIMRGAIVDHARVEWSKITPPQASCIEEVLQRQGHSIGGLIQNGVAPGDPRVSSIRFGCRTVTVPPPAPNATPIDAENLSAKPTFDCTKGRSLTAHVICLDQEGAAADWELSSAYWARYFSLPESDQRSFDEARQRWLEASNQICRARAQNQRECVLSAYRKRTTAYRSQLDGDALAETRLSPEQHAQIQKSLIALGLLDDSADGEFGSMTRAAIKRYKVQLGAAEGEFLTAPQRHELLHGKSRVEAQAPGSNQSQTQEPVPPSPPIETAKLKEARAFLEDSKKYIADQKSVPSISAIAHEAAALQISIDKLDEHEAVQSMQRLSELLKGVPGFLDFEQQRQDARKAEDARRLVEARILGTRNTFFIDHYMKEHLGDSKTASLLKLREQIDDSLKKNRIEEISRANGAIGSYITQNGLSDAYEASSGKFTNPTPPTSEAPKSLKERLGLGENSTVLVEGVLDDIVLLYNASASAPSVWKNVRGDIVFQRDAASLCFAQSNSDVAMVRYIEHILGDKGAKKLTTASAPCDLSQASSSIDVIAFQRGELLKDREDYILALAKMMEGETFRKYEIVMDYAKEFQNRQMLSLEIETDIDGNTRKGFGVITTAGSPVACVITPNRTERGDGLKELLRRNTAVIAPAVTGDWKTVDTANTDLAFLGLQRRQCGYLLGEASALGLIMPALRRDNLKYAFAPVWWSYEEVDQATFDVNDARQQEIIKKDQIKQQQQALDALTAQRARDKETQKTEIERRLREKNGVKARGVENDIHDLVSGVAEKRAIDRDGVFSSYSEWMDRRFADHWETFSVNSEIADFGLIQWQRRPLQAIVVMSVIHQKNRILGKYEDQCYMFGLVDDEEFNMWRESFAVDCTDGSFVSRWKIGKSFQSQWNAN
jgi:uncharacterized protein